MPVSLRSLSANSLKSAGFVASTCGVRSCDLVPVSLSVCVALPGQQLGQRGQALLVRGLGPIQLTHCA